MGVATLPSVVLGAGKDEVQWLIFLVDVIAPEFP